MKYACVDVTTYAPVIGWYLVRDADDPDGFDYPLLPPDVVAMTQTQWDARATDSWYDPVTRTFGPTPPPPPMTLAQRQALACAGIDAAAAALDARYQTSGGSQAQIYAAKRDQAAAYKAAGYPALADPLPAADANYALYGHVRAYRAALRVTDATATDQGAADGIIAARDRYATLIGVQREELRLVGKARVRAATTEADVNTARDAAISQLQAL